MKFLNLAFLATATAAAAIDTPETLEARKAPTPYKSYYLVSNFYGEHVPNSNRVNFMFDVENPNVGIAKTHCAGTRICAGMELCTIGPRVVCDNPKVSFQVNNYPDYSYGHWQVHIQYERNGDYCVGSNYSIKDKNDVFVEVPKGSGREWEMLLPPNRAYNATALSVGCFYD